AAWEEGDSAAVSCASDFTAPSAMPAAEVLRPPIANEVLGGALLGVELAHAANTPKSTAALTSTAENLRIVLFPIPFSFLFARFSLRHALLLNLYDSVVADRKMERIMILLPVFFEPLCIGYLYLNTVTVIHSPVHSLVCKR
ncbi:MAG: hypothetical protein GX485_06090, partial [Clostridiales bacterium]|nr:hypothetical protein [Clostridiales bacterium]